MTKKKLFNISFFKKNIVFIVAGITCFIILVVFCITQIEKVINGNKIISFENPALERAVKKDLHDPNISVNDAKKVKSLKIENCSQIEDLSELHYFLNLEELHIENSAVSSLDGISNLYNLNVLSCINCGIEDIAELKNCSLSSLKYVELTGNDFKEIANISINADNLETLILNDCNLNGIISIGTKEKLTTLEMDNNFITALEGSMPSLELLSLSNNCIDNIQFIYTFMSVKELDISGNPVDEIWGISQMEKLESLDITETQIKDISKLEELKYLNAIYLDEDFDRSKIDFIINNFRNGDPYTKQYILGKKYDLTKGLEGVY